MSTEKFNLPDWQSLEPVAVVPALEQLLARNRQKVETLCEDHGEPSWDNFAAPLESLEDDVSRFWAPVSHMHAVNNTAEWRAAYDRALPLLTEYNTEMGQHRQLFQRWQQLADTGRIENAVEGETATRRKAMADRLRDFRLAGVALEGEARRRYGELAQRLAKLSTAFANNVLDATRGWEYHTSAAADLDGVPPPVMETLAAQARQRNKEGYVITLDIPSYLPVMQSCTNRQLRQQLYLAYTTRASDQGPCAGRWDNSNNMVEILQLRQELARLLGFANYAEWSLVPKMAQGVGEVLDFLQQLATRSVPVARRELDELSVFARETLGLTELQAWDVAFASERLREARFQVSQQALRPWFPVQRVLDGMLAIAGRLFDVSFERRDAPVWHPDVAFYQVRRGAETLAGFYLDLFARESKRGGAWMADCAVRRRLPNGSMQLPVAMLTCNFTPPDDRGVSLLTHDEVTTLFHEFGHGLHHMLTTVEVAAVSGINGVEWDAVELPSQFLENWCWQREGLALISAHIETGEPLPREQLERLLAARNFQSAMQMVRQLEFALFDMRLHAGSPPGSSGDIQSVLDQVRAEVSVVPIPPSNRFQHSFGHIFAGGYAAGYYSYKWAEVLSADAFSRFEDEGIFNPLAGQSFRREILEAGGRREAMASFVSFRGRRPSVEPLLRHHGLAEADRG